MKARRFTFLLLLGATCVAADKEPWLQPLPDNVESAQPGYEIPSKDIREIPSSLTEAALQLLEQRAIVPITNAYFGGVATACGTPSQPFLVRALYERGSTGKFWVSRYGSALYVIHRGLGPVSEKHRTALIVCLEFTPARVYVDVSGAM